MTFNIQENVPMWNRLSFKAGGLARFFAEIETVEDLQQARLWALEKQIPVFILGNGTNVLIADSGFNGLILKLGKSFSKIHFEVIKNVEENAVEFFGTINPSAADDVKAARVVKDLDSLKAECSGKNLNGCVLVRAGGASVLGVLARKASANGFGGIHKLAGIPGTVGGAIYMNAGAYGQEISETLQRIKVLTPEGKIEIHEKDFYTFGYRYSDFQKNGHWILEAEFLLPFGNSEILEREIAECMLNRRTKQPLDKPNAGSAFKRPENGFPGAFIEAAGLKGFSIGGAQVSEKHANFIINANKATATDIYKLFSYVQNKVFEHSGVRLKREVIFLGEFPAEKNEIVCFD